MELKPGAAGVRWCCWCLLIVPYGIETCYQAECPICVWLLIVPYGIETNLGFYWLSNRDTFNRTLWN